jgi:hypothetical protein
VGPFGVGGGGLVDGGDRLDEEVVPAEAGVAFTAVRVEDPDGRPPPRRAVSIASDQRLRPLADDVATQPDPRPSRQLEAQAARLGDGAGHRPRQPGRFEDDEERLRPTGERRQPTEPVGDHPGSIGLRQPAARQVEQQEIDRPPGQQAAGDRQALVECLGRDDHEPLESDAARDRLDRIERPGEVQPGHHRAGHLGLGDEPKRQGGPSARAVATDGDAGGSRQATRSEDGVEAREPGGDDPVVGAGRGPGSPVGERLIRGRQRHRPDDSRSCGTPPGLEARDSGVDISTSGRHRTAIVEHLF